MNKLKPCVNEDVVWIHHKGELCIYKSILCQEDLCLRCTIPITCAYCGLIDEKHVHVENYQGEKVPICDEILGCIERGTKRIVEENKNKAVR